MRTQVIWLSLFLVLGAGCASPAKIPPRPVRPPSDQPLLIRMGGPEAVAGLADDWLSRIERDAQLGPRLLPVGERPQRVQRLADWLVAAMDGAPLPVLPQPLGGGDVPRLADLLQGSLDRFYIGARERGELLEKVRAAGRP
jgi:hypothetical protein